MVCPSSVRQLHNQARHLNRITKLKLHNNKKVDAKTRKTIKNTIEIS